MYLLHLFLNLTSFKLRNEEFPCILHSLTLDREKPQRTPYFQNMFKNWFHKKNVVVHMATKCPNNFFLKKKSYIDFVQNYYKSLYFPPWMNHYIDINSNNHDIHVGWWSRCMINKHFCLHTINKLTNWKHVSMNLHHSIDVPPNKVGLPFTRHSLVIECLVNKQILTSIQSNIT